MESILGCAVFAMIFVGTTAKNPLSQIHNYPPAIQERCKKLGLITEGQMGYRKKDWMRKLIGIVLLGLVLGFLVYNFNDADTFFLGFAYSYLLWNIINWFDVIVLDCIWFCHSKKVIIPGTEDMKEYKDYLFHIKGGFKGVLFGLPACLLAGAFVLLF